MVVGIECETHGRESLGKQFVPQEGRLDAPVEGLNKAYIEGGNTVFVDDENTVCGVNVAQEANGVTSELHDDKVPHISIEVSAGDVGSGDVAAFVGID